MFQRDIELKFFGRAISNDKKVEKEIKIQRVAVQWTDGAGQNLRVHRGESQFQLLRTHTRKYIKVVQKSRSKVSSVVAQRGNLSTALQVNSHVKSL